MTASPKKKPLEPDRTPEVNAAIEETKAYLLKCASGLRPDFGDPIRQMVLSISTMARTSTTYKQEQEMLANGIPWWEICLLDEGQCRKLFDMAKAGNCDADAVLRRHVRGLVKETRLSPVLAEFVEWRLRDDTEVPREKSLRSMTQVIAAAVAHLQLKGYKRNSKPRKGKPNASAFWIVSIALGELIAEGKLLSRDIGVKGTSPANIAAICEGVPYLRGPID